MCFEKRTAPVVAGAVLIRWIGYAERLVRIASMRFASSLVYTISSQSSQAYPVTAMVIVTIFSVSRSRIMYDEFCVRGYILPPQM